MPAEYDYHESVLLNECIEHLCIKPNGTYVDVTFGGGGHSKEILKRLGPKGKLIAFDQDADALRNVPKDNRILFINENFQYIKRFLRLYKHPQVDGILADLGVSSHHFDEADRGFSIRFNAELDMRMDQRGGLKANDIVNTFTEKELHKLFEQYGEVSNARTLARTLVERRQAMHIRTIADFKQAIQDCVKGNPNKYFAQVFQALRIEVNAEIPVLQQFCKDAISCLAPQGRLCIISFHSLEDRIVKQAMKGNDGEASQQNPFVQNVKNNELKIITPKPITPSEEELRRNTRSRSARLRVAEKLT